LPKLFNLRTDPYERADVTSNTYYDWLIDHSPQLNLGVGRGPALPRHVQGVPTAAESCELHHRSSTGENKRSHRGALIGRLGCSIRGFHRRPLPVQPAGGCGLSVRRADMA
jgi:hypothetical protein